MVGSPILKARVRGGDLLFPGLPGSEGLNQAWKERALLSPADHGASFPAAAPTTALGERLVNESRRAEWWKLAGRCSGWNLKGPSLGLSV